jgi:hypothetical protein
VNWLNGHKTYGVNIASENSKEPGNLDRYIDGEGQEMRLFSIVSKLSLGPTLTPIRWVTMALSFVARGPCGSSDHSHPSRMGELPISLHGAVLP